jgi:hypothetical protein
MIMLGWVLVLSGCAAINKGPNIERESVRSWDHPRTNPQLAVVSEKCEIEANNLMNGDFRGDYRAWRAYFKQCMLRNGYDVDVNYVGMEPE